MAGRDTRSDVASASGLVFTVCAVVLDDFFSLPRRVFLDSSTLQTLQDYGGFIWEGEPIPDNDRIFAIPGHPEEVQALRAIFTVNDRAMFEFPLSESSLAEVEAKNDSSYLRWAFDVGLPAWPRPWWEASGQPPRKNGSVFKPRQRLARRRRIGAVRSVP